MLSFTDGFNSTWNSMLYILGVITPFILALVAVILVLSIAMIIKWTIQGTLIDRSNERARRIKNELLAKYKDPPQWK